MSDFAETKVERLAGYRRLKASLRGLPDPSASSREDGPRVRAFDAGYRRALHDVLHECKGHARRAAGTPHESGARWLLTVVRDMLRRVKG